MRSKRIFDITSRTMPDGGASLVCRMRYDAPKDSATTAVAKAMNAINKYCEGTGLNIRLVPHDPVTGKTLKVSYTRER